MARESASGQLGSSQAPKWAVLRQHRDEVLAMLQAQAAELATLWPVSLPTHGRRTTGPFTRCAVWRSRDLVDSATFPLPALHGRAGPRGQAKTLADLLRASFESAASREPRGDLGRFIAQRRSPDRRARTESSRHGSVAVPHGNFPRSHRTCRGAVSRACSTIHRREEEKDERDNFRVGKGAVLPRSRAANVALFVGTPVSTGRTRRTKICSGIPSALIPTRSSSPLRRPRMRASHGRLLLGKNWNA